MSGDPSAAVAGNAALYQTTRQLISEDAFKVVLWVGVGICAAVCVMRFLIRLMCFRRLFVEDYLMVAAMSVLIALAVILQVYLGDLYTLLHVQNMVEAPGPNFINQMLSGLKGDAIAIVLSIIGLWMIKLNFLLLFWRIGEKIQTYRILWWIALVLVMACGVVNIALIPYDCMLGGLLHISVSCAVESKVHDIYVRYIVSVTMDVLSDLIIICFPVLIVWKTGLNWRQKLVLSSVFLLVSFTIGVTIVRGSIFGGVYKAVNQIDRRVIDSSWMLFWWYIEYIVSFVIACLVSFRSLWSSNNKRSSSYRKQEAEKARILQQAQNSPVASSDKSRSSRWRRFHDSLLATFADLEDTTIDNEQSFLKLQPHLATMDLDFSVFGNNDSSREESLGGASKKSRENSVTETTRSVG